LKNVIVLTEAAAGIEGARDYYEEREAGLGEYCVSSVLTDLESLAVFSGIHSRHFGFNRMISTHFPFGIYYRAHGDDTLVVAILDLRRNPKWIRKQLHQRRTPNE
jgi:plasmid stabilization system protein ParE